MEREPRLLFGTVEGCQESRPDDPVTPEHLQRKGVTVSVVSE